MKTQKRIHNASAHQQAEMRSVERAARIVQTRPKVMIIDGRK